MVKTWSWTQGAYALSSAEAELYAMVEAVARSKDSSAATSFVCRRGFGKMRHLEIKNLWLQKEVREGRLEVSWWKLRTLLIS